MILNALRSVASGTSGLRDGRPQPCLGLGLGSEGRKPALISQTPGGMNFGLKMDENRMPGKHTGRKNGRLGKHTARESSSSDDHDVTQKYQESDLVEFPTQD